MRYAQPIVVCAVLAVVPTLQAQQQSAPNPATPVRGAVGPSPSASSVPRLADGKPDFAGVWRGGGPAGNIEDGLAPGETIPLLPAARKLKESRLAKDEPSVNCLPTGVPRLDPLPWRFVQTPTHVFILFEFNTQFRQIFVDGRSHPPSDALNPTWYGHSVGRWEGDTFVVDTVGFNDKSWFDYVGHPHTDRLHVVERYTRTTFDTLVNEITIDDPGAYSRPFNVTFSARLLPDGELMEYICNENNKDAGRMQGPAVRTRPDGTVAPDGRR